MAKFSRIVVADSSTPWPQDTLAVSSLAAACRDARQWGVKQIELHYNGPRPESKLDIADLDLTISAASGYQPLVVFRPTGNDPDSESAMIRCSGARLIWQGVHLLLDLTEAPRQSWSLFRLRPFASLDVRDSIFTVRNIDVSQRKRLEQVDFFVLEHRNAGGRSWDAAPAPIPHHANLTNTILRGQATVVRAEQATAFRLCLQNSLVVARGWLVDVEGSGAKPGLKEGRVDLVLKGTTASLRDGLCRMASDQQTPHQIDLHTEFSDSILYLTDSNSPLFERVGVGRLADIEKRFDLRGRDNFYPGSTTVLRLRPNAQFGEVVDFDFDARDRMPFLEEKSPGFMLMWESQPAAEVTEDQHTAEHYQLDESEFNPGVLIGDTETAGVDIRRLPPSRPLSAAAGSSAGPNS